MKTLYLLRHAKSSWSDKSLPDQERPLKKRGLKDRQRVADTVTPEHKAPHCIHVSSAERTKQTVPPFAKAWKLKADQVRVYDTLYLASDKTLLKHLKKVDNGIDILMIVGHNPGITDLFNFLAPKKEYVSHFPTCSFLALELPVKRWADLEAHCALSAEAYRPKDIGD